MLNHCVAIEKCNSDVVGVGGLPYARPHFGLAAEDGIRHEHDLCCRYEPGNSIPLNWYDGGEGWVAKYFYDDVPRNAAVYEPGTFRCQVPLPEGKLCNHQVVEDDYCKRTCCWHSGTAAHSAMREHLAAAHGLQPPPRRQWASGLCDTEGCCEALFCAPCQGSRQVMAMSGHADTLHWGWCFFMTYVGARSTHIGGAIAPYWIPPWIYIALLTRDKMVTLNNIDESCCSTWAKAIFCSLCSVAQTYRELNASGVSPGLTSFPHCSMESNNQPAAMV